MFRIGVVFLSAVFALLVVMAVIVFEGRGAVLVMGHVVNVDPIRDWLVGPAGALWLSMSGGMGIVSEILLYAVMGIYYFLGFGILAKYWADERHGLAVAILAVMAVLNTVSTHFLPT